MYMTTKEWQLILSDKCSQVLNHSLDLRVHLDSVFECSDITQVDMNLLSAEASNKLELFNIMIQEIFHGARDNTLSDIQ